MDTFKKALLTPVISLFTVFTLLGCEYGAESPRGFNFPVGNIEMGQAIFLSSRCLSCHALKGLEDPSIKKQIDPPIKLGGKTNRTTTYAELVTSIINPSHKQARGYEKGKIQKDGISLMQNYNETMTVNELINLVTFLETHYELKPYQRYHYSPYSP